MISCSIAGPDIFLVKTYAPGYHGFSLPMSNFLFTLLSLRLSGCRQQEFVFPSRKGIGHIHDPSHAVTVVVKSAGCAFVPHDLRRTFISMAARIGVLHNIIKKLVNHAPTGDITERYVVLEPEVLREYMEKITEKFLYLFSCDMTSWQLPDPRVLDGKRMIRKRRFDSSEPQQLKLF